MAKKSGQNSVYNKAPAKSPQFGRMAARKPVKYSCANEENRLTGRSSHKEPSYAKGTETREYGGDRGDAIFGGGSPRYGQSREGAPAAVANRKPPNAHAFASFDGVGGSVKKPTLG